MTDSQPNTQHASSSQPKKNTLSEFIDINHKLISVLGVFTALTVFSYNLALKPIGYALSFVFLTLTVIVWLELWAKFPKRPSSWRLTTFENILSYSTIGVIAYWLLAYREIWRIVLFFPVWLLTISIISYPVTKFGLLEKLFGWKFAQFTIVRYIFGFFLLFLALYIAGIIAAVVTPPINNFLDQLREELDKILPPESVK